jgi:hypothetical protein
VGLGKLPVLPQKLLKETPPGVEGVLFKWKSSGKKMPVRNPGTGYAGFLCF